MPVLDGIEVNVIAMSFKITIVPQCVFPVPSLPNAAFAFGAATCRPSLTGFHSSREHCLDQPPAGREIRIARRQGPDGMEVVRQNGDGLNCKRVASSDGTKRGSKQIDSLREQLRLSVSEIDREEEAAAWNEVASVSSHRQMIERDAERWRSIDRFRIDGYREAPPILR